MSNRLEEIKKEIVKETKYDSWAEYWTVLGMTNDYSKMQQLSDEVSKRYAIEVAKASLEKATEVLFNEVTIFDKNGDEDYCKNEEIEYSLNQESNITLL